METKTVAILSPGEMGHSVASVLIKHGLRVVTSLEGRSQRTRELTEKTGIINLPTLDDVVTESDLIMSVVVPSAAQVVGSHVAEAISRTGHQALFADANAISPMTSEAIGETISAAGGRYIDACIIGYPNELETKTILYVSGPYAGELTTLNNFGLNVEVLGDRVGQASAFKVLYAGMTKGVTSVAVELLVTAHSIGLYEQILDKYRNDYPEIVRLVEHWGPGIPFRSARRSHEMVELTRVIKKEGFTPNMAPGSSKVLKMIGDLNLRSQYSDADEARWSLKDVIEILARGLKNNPTNNPGSP
jgi:3-hydroxyisobutyrate dehydrogenase-like beta-hydroxyacid dehydrogenase